MHLAALKRLSAGAMIAMLAAAMPLPAMARPVQGCPPLRSAQPVVDAHATFLTGNGKVRVVGYNDMDEMMPALGARFTALNPGIAFDFQLKSTRSGPPALTDGSSAFAPMGAEFTEQDRAEFRRAWGTEPIAVRIAHASLKPGAISSPTGIFVHRSNPLTRISLEDARRVFVGGGGHGALGDWDALLKSWAGRPIHPVGMAPHTALGLFLLGGPLRGSGFVSAYDGRAQSREVAAAVATDPSAIGLANLSNARPEIRAVEIVDARGRVSRPVEAEIVSGRYPFDRHLLIYVRLGAGGTIELLSKAFLNLVLSCEGQKLIASGSRGYLPLAKWEVVRERQRIGL